MRRIILIILVVMSVAGLTEPALAKNYVLSILAQVGDTIDGNTLNFIDSTSPDINDNVEVAFISGSSGIIGIFTQNALLVAQGQSINGITLNGIGPANPCCSLNNNGDVAFLGALSRGAGIFTQNQLLVQTGQTIDGEIMERIRGGDFNDNGQLVFFNVNIGGAGIFTPNSLLVKEGDTIDGKTLTSVNTDPRINNKGDVAFRGLYLDGLQSFSGIFTPNSLLVGTGQTISGKTLTGVSPPALNNNGDVAFAATFSGGQGVFTQDALLVETGDIIDGVTLTDIEIVDLNENGDVVFRGGHSDQRENGIFTQNVLVAQIGQIIGGNILIGLGAYPSINNNGDIAFVGTFDDDQRRIILANPRPDSNVPSHACDQLGQLYTEMCCATDKPRCDGLSVAYEAAGCGDSAELCD